MGACQFKERSTGKTIQEAYYRACEVAVEEYGHQDGYNGTISTTHSFRDETEAYKKSKFDDVSAYIRDRFDSHSMNKRDCSAICVVKPIANKNKTKTQVEHVVTPGTKKWVLKYEVEEHYGDGKVLASCPQKGDAVKMARAYTEKTGNTTVVMMRKLLLGPNLTAKITYKRASDERDGEWIFFGYAAE
jgi:2,4-dienoyl-CoA reductase-like NADH-dependent reductase (Old Yellow Enzyme family)